MRARQAIQQAREQLKAAGCAEARREAQLICAYLCCREPGQLAFYLEQDIDEARLKAVLRRRAAGEPLQYVLGEAGFMGLTFVLGPGALIPRADTEVLAEKAITLLKEAKAPRIADIGAGCGAIGLSLAYYLPTATVCGVDISPDTLKWANKNAAALGLGKRCRFYRGDLLAPLSALDIHFDLIISNPPYLTAAEMAQLTPEVQQEPALALAGGPDGLAFYRRLAQEAAPLLKPGGWLLVEHGWQQQEQVAALLNQAGWQVLERLNDYGGRARGLLASFL